MKVFFDEDVPRKLARYLPQHDIQTVVSMQWGGIKNGVLITLIEREGFDVFLTGDKEHGKSTEAGGTPFRRAGFVRNQLAGGAAAHS